jgi:arylsulfatase A-like enzyme
MTRPAAGALLAILITGCSTAPTPRQRATADDRPNIVFLLADDHAAHAISAYQSHLRYGIKLPKTPNLDRLAQDGMLFVNSFVTNSICGPARATVLTGQYGHINGVMTNSEPLHPTTVTFPALLQQAGYSTAIFGKWHLRTRPAGFDHYEILVGQGPYYNPVLLSPSDSLQHTGYTLDLATSKALDWLDDARASSRPFMMMLAFNGPHRWWDPGPDQLALYRDTMFAVPATFSDRGEGRASPARDPEMQIALDLIPRDLKLEPPNNLTPSQRAKWDSAYAAENAAMKVAGLNAEELARWKYQRYIADYMRVIAALDQQVGRVLGKLEETGLSKNTIVVYSSDQGFFLGDHGWFDKRWMYEESLRTPLIVRWPGVARPGSVNRDLVMNLDIAETFLDIAGAPVPATMQGVSIVPLLRGMRPRDWRDAIYYQYFEYPGWHAVRRQYGVRTDRYKLIHYYEVDEWELFDLLADPEELKSLYADPAYSRIRSTLEQRLAALRKEYAVPAADPAPYYPWELPPQYRRPGTPGSTRNAEIGAEGMRHERH